MVFTPKLIQSIKNIQDPVLRNRYIRYHQAPPRIQEALFSEQNNDIIYNIVVEKNHLSNEQWAGTSLAIAKIFLSELHPQRLERYLQENLQISVELADSISRELKNKILLPIKEDLQQIYSANIEKQDAVPANLPIKPAQSVVKIEGNLVKLEK